MNISEFNKNDYITRIDISKNNDKSFMSEKMQFVGISDGTIVIVHEKYGAMCLPALFWSEGWAYYPQNLMDEAKKMDINFKDNL